MSFTLLILQSDYPDFLDWMYACHQGLMERPYDEQLTARYRTLFGMADFYSSNLGLLGVEAVDVFANNFWLQRQWALEHGLPTPNDRPALVSTSRLLAAKMHAKFRHLGALLPLLRRAFRRVSSLSKDLYSVLAAQIRHYQPDVILNLSMDGIGAAFLRNTRGDCKLVIGQIAAPLPLGEDYSCYDLIISSLPNLVAYFRKMGVRAEFQRLAFEPRILERLRRKKPIPVSFVGTVSSYHAARCELLEYVCARQEVCVAGRGVKALSKSSAIRRSYVGPAFGIEMYELLYNSRITINNHIGVAAQFANNMRLFEATGVGSLVITDQKENLHEMFAVGDEVVTYRTPEECAQVVGYYLEHEESRQAVAAAGQKRTLTAHTYAHRAAELLDIVRSRLRDTTRPLRATSGATRTIDGREASKSATPIDTQ
jgi:hypothetical protein